MKKRGGENKIEKRKQYRITQFFFVGVNIFGYIYKVAQVSTSSHPSQKVLLLNTNIQHHKKKKALGLLNSR